MGLTFVNGTVTGPKGKQKKVKFLVDSGIYSLLPRSVWKSLGVKPTRRETFTLADGTEIHREVSECHIALAGREGHSPVILGQPGDDALLGVITLENLGLMLDPFRRTLQKMHLRLA